MRIFLLCFIFSVSAALCFAGDGSAQLVYKENKGQWQSNILAKAEIKNGAIFFENNTITFNLFDIRDILRIKGDHHKMEAYTHDIDNTMHFHAFKMKFVNAAQQPVMRGADPIKEYFSYFIGNDKSKWASKVQGFTQLNYNNLYPGIALKITSKETSLKYVYEVATNTNADQVQVNFEGTDGIALNEDGSMLIKTSVGDITDLKPYAYQLIHGKEIEVPCVFALKDNTISYKFPKGYNTAQALYIDPTMIFSTYSGSTADNFGYSATYDSKGNAFSAGSVFGVGYPVTTGAFQMSYMGGPTIFFTTGGSYPGDDISITKYSSDGTQRIFSTYLGGYGEDLAHSLIVNSNDELYVLGTTDCANYPTTANAYDRTFNGGPDPGVFDGIAAHYAHGSDIIISRLSVDGSQLLASTYVGGSGNDGLNYTAGQPYSSPGFLRHNYADELRGEIEIDDNNNIYVASCTNSVDFPRTANTIQNGAGGGLDACVFKMDANLSTMIWSTTFGGGQDDAAYSIAIDRNENLFVAGGTRSFDFPIKGGVVQQNFAGGDCDGFITHIDKNGQTILASTFYGYADYDQIYFVDLDKAGNVYVLGQADNAASNFIFNAAYNKPNGGQFISKFNESLDTLVWSTSFGRGIGKTDISPTAFLVDVCSNVYACGWGSQNVNNEVTGFGGTTGLDVTSNAYKAVTDGQDFYLMVMKDDASALAYATFIGGNQSPEHVDGGTSRFDKKGVVYEAVCAGCGGLSDFPTTAGAASVTNNSNNCNNAVFKFDLNLPLCIANFTAPNGCKNTDIQFTNLSTSVLSPTYTWTFGDGSSSTQQNPLHSFGQTGLYNITLIVNDPGSCNFADTISKKILVIGGSGIDTLPTLTICSAKTTQIGFPPNNDSTITYSWSPSNTLSAGNVSNPVASPTQTTTYQLLASNGICIDTFKQTVDIFTDAITLNGNDALCPGDTLRLGVTNSQPGQQLTYSWAPTAQIISGANTATPLVSPAQSTTYNVTVTNQIGCSFTGSIQINIHSGLANLHVTATPDTILVGDTSQLNLTTNGVISSITWTPDNTLSATNIANPLAYPQSTHTYYVEVADTQGCRKRDSVTVYFKHEPCKSSNIYIPNAFSPNGDGKNEVLYVRGNDIVDLYFAVYDRWGQKMFETKDISKGWDGTYKGKKMDPAVFGYYVQGTCITQDKFSKKGNVTLLK